MKFNRILLGVTIALAFLSAGLLGLLFYAEGRPAFASDLARDSFDIAVKLAVASTVLLTVVVVPYALVGLIRGTLRIGMLLGMLAGLGVSGACLGGIALVFAVAAAG